MKVKSESVFATPWTAAYQAVHGIFQARGLEWGAIEEEGMLSDFMKPHYSDTKAD